MDFSLLGLAVVTGLLHTLMGPDHYVPFIALGRVRRWSLARTLAVTAACGLGHVLSSAVLGLIGIGLGLGIGRLQSLESARGSLAAWLLLGFGLAYTLWGVRRALRSRTHTHWHGHGDGTVHCHAHAHQDAHVHLHAYDERRGATPWVLFIVFVFGPCEVLIPQVMVPAASHSWTGVLVVTGVFAASTLAAMLAAVTIGYASFGRLFQRNLERYAHAAAGLAVSACAVLIMLGW